MTDFKYKLLVGLYLNQERFDVIKQNKDYDYLIVDKCVHYILQAIKNKKYIVCFPIYFTYDDAKLNHSNLLIYKHNLLTFDWFEPNGNDNNNNLYIYFSMIFNEIKYKLELIINEKLDTKKNLLLYTSTLNLHSLSIKERENNEKCMYLCAYILFLSIKYSNINTNKIVTYLVQKIPKFMEKNWLYYNLNAFLSKFDKSLKKASKNKITIETLSKYPTKTKSILIELVNQKIDNKNPNCLKEDLSSNIFLKTDKFVKRNNSIDSIDSRNDFSSDSKIIEFKKSLNKSNPVFEKKLERLQTKKLRNAFIKEQISFLKKSKTKKFINNHEENEDFQLVTQSSQLFPEIEEEIEEIDRSVQSDLQSVSSNSSSKTRKNILKTKKKQFDSFSSLSSSIGTRKKPGLYAFNPIKHCIK